MAEEKKPVQEPEQEANTEPAEESAKATREWIRAVAERHYEHVQPILTPRFTPSCSDELMELLHDIQKETGLPVQSHLSENPGEIAWVQELCPWAEFYGDAYDHFGMFGGKFTPVKRKSAG